MQKYPMKAYAVGRFLIDLPKAATDLQISQRIYGTDIEWKPSTEAQYRTTLSTRLNGLIGINPESKLLVSDESGPVANSRIILFEQNSDRSGFIGYEAYRYSEEIGGYFQIKGSAERARVGIVGPWVNRILALIQPRIIDPNMIERGTCFDHAFIPGKDPLMRDNVAIIANLDAIRVRFSAQVVERIDEGPSLLERAEQINRFPGARLLRKSRREIAGLGGSEFSFVDTPQASSAYSFQWEYPGQPSSIVAPRVEVSIDTTGLVSIAEGELLGLWDAILNSIRLRPGAV
jgi:hypothetical protein